MSAEEWASRIDRFEQLELRGPDGRRLAVARFAGLYALGEARKSVWLHEADAAGRAELIARLAPCSTWEPRWIAAAAAGADPFDAGVQLSMSSSSSGYSGDWTVQRLDDGRYLVTDEQRLDDAAGSIPTKDERKTVDARAARAALIEQLGYWGSNQWALPVQRAPKPK